MDRHHLDRVAVGEFGQNTDQQPKRRSRQLDLVRLILLVEDLWMRWVSTCVVR